MWRWSLRSTSPGMSNIASKPPKARWRGRPDSLSQAQEPTLRIPWPWTCNIQNTEIIHFYYLSQVGGTLLRQSYKFIHHLTENKKWTHRRSQKASPKCTLARTLESLLFSWRYQAHSSAGPWLWTALPPTPSISIDLHSNTPMRPSPPFLSSSSSFLFFTTNHHQILKTLMVVDGERLCQDSWAKRP